jgi:hypothetical protein
MYYQANDRVTDGDDPDPLPTTNIEMTSDDPVATAANELDAYDRVDLTDGGQPAEIFELSATDTDGDPVTDANGDPIYVRLVDETRDDEDELVGRTYQVVDIIADASQTDSGDRSGTDDTADDLHPVTQSIPAAKLYSHIHFGLWAGLNAKGSAIDDLGIGFVQNFDGSDVTVDSITGKATFNGDWVAAVRRKFASDGEKGAIMLRDGHAALTANFSTDKFTADLDMLATLSGSLSGNEFKGTSATKIMHPDLEATGTFKGSFSGAIYGAEGAEAAGVFSFDGDEAGAFTGAFGGRDADQPVKQ